MGLNYSQKRLLSQSWYRRAHKTRSGGGEHATLSSMTKKKNWRNNLEIYAFWTGFMSTVISLVQVILLAIRQ